MRAGFKLRALRILRLVECFETELSIFLQKINEESRRSAGLDPVSSELLFRIAHQEVLNGPWAEDVLRGRRLKAIAVIVLCHFLDEIIDRQTEVERRLFKIRREIAAYLSFGVAEMFVKRNIDDVVEGRKNGCLRELHDSRNKGEVEFPGLLLVRYEKS